MAPLKTPTYHGSKFQLRLQRFHLRRWRDVHEREIPRRQANCQLSDTHTQISHKQFAGKHAEFVALVRVWGWQLWTGKEPILQRRSTSESAWPRLHCSKKMMTAGHICTRKHGKTATHKHRCQSRLGEALNGICLLPMGTNNHTSSSAASFFPSFFSFFSFGFAFTGTCMHSGHGLGKMARTLAPPSRPHWYQDLLVPFSASHQPALTNISNPEA